MKNPSILITGGAGFIGSNLIEHFLATGKYTVVCLDNLSTGYLHNLEPFLKNSDFKFIEGDIRSLETCREAVKDCDYVLHHAALGSVPRSIHDPITTNDVNINGFLNMLVASRDEKVKRFIYAASSSTYGDSQALPKKEDVIGKPLSPYGITKYVNELYADIFSKSFGMETIGLRYFNIFGRRQDPSGAYAAVIPFFVKKLINHENLIINGDGSFSRDFTYIDNVIQMNELAMLSTNVEAINTVYNTAVGERTTLNELVSYLKELLTPYDSKTETVEIIHAEKRVGDIPHSLASIEKAEKLLGYKPSHNIKKGLKEAIDWYWENLK